MVVIHMKRRKLLILLASVVGVLVLVVCGAWAMSASVGGQAATQGDVQQTEIPTQTIEPAPVPAVTPSPVITPSPTPSPTPLPTQQVSPSPAPTPTQSGGSSLGGQTGQGTAQSTSPSGKTYGYYDTVQPTYVKGVLLVNKTYALPRSYGGDNATATAALNRLQAAAKSAGYSLPLISGYRSFDTQDRIYRNYAARDGVAAANTYSAWPGHSEHQTGLAFDVGSLSNGFGKTAAGKWLASHAHQYGFIIRYPKGKESITGYQYEPWHIRYLGERSMLEHLRRQQKKLLGQ